MNSALFNSDLMHHRFLPREHRFSYRVYAWLFDLAELDQLDKELTFFSRNKFNFFSFFDDDYGNKSDQPLTEQVNEKLCHYGLETAEDIYLLCYPRVLGYVFNPLSVYYCFRAGELYATVYEVSNTFGERHSYIIPAGLEGASRVYKQSADKELHVSPFFEMDCSYLFKIKEPGQSLYLNIELFQQKNKNNHQNKENRLFVANLSGSRVSISNKSVIRSFFAVPFQTIKVMVAIHWQAIKLWLKGIPIIKHKPSKEPVAVSKGTIAAWATNTTGEK